MVHWPPLQAICFISLVAPVASVAPSSRSRVVVQEVDAHGSLLRAEEARRHSPRHDKNKTLSSAALGKQLPLHCTGPDACIYRRLVPGHIASPVLVEQVHQASSGHNCSTIWDKALQMVDDYIEILLDQQGHDGQVPQWVMEVRDDVMQKRNGTSTMEELDRVIGNEGLTAGTQHGHIWTQDDEALWATCNGQPNGTEVNTQAGGRHLQQGDELETNGTLSFLEAAIRGLRWAGNTWAHTTSENGMNIAEIKYCFATSASAQAKTSFQAAVDHVQTQVPCLKFTEVNAATGGSNTFDNTDENCVEFPSIIVQSHMAGCWSPVGQASGIAQYATSSQPINLGTNCEMLGIAAHEIGHALGMLHEMNRQDRDEWIEILSANVDQAYIANMHVTLDAQGNAMAYQGTSFDYLSLMMYGAYTFSANGEMTIEPHDLRLVRYMGQRMGFSELDVEHIGLMYGCLDQINPLTRNKHLSEAYLNNVSLDYDGPCKDKENTGFDSNDGTPMTCHDLRSNCNHHMWGDDIQSTCPVSCLMCIPGQDQAAATGSGTDIHRSGAERCRSRHLYWLMAVALGLRLGSSGLL